MSSPAKKSGVESDPGGQEFIRMRTERRTSTSFNVKKVSRTRTERPLVHPVEDKDQSYKRQGNKEKENRTWEKRQKGGGKHVSLATKNQSIPLPTGLQGAESGL